MYEMVRQRIADQYRIAEQYRIARQAREQRANTRRRRASDAAETAARVTIPDFADEMFGELRDAVPAPGTCGRPARPGR